MTAETGIYAREFPALGCYVQVGVAGGKILRLSFPKEPDEEASEDNHVVFDCIERYLEGDRETFRDIEIALTVPTDQRKVLEQVRKIPYGTTISGDSLASQVPGLESDSGEDINHIRQTLATNPIPLVIPSHRVANTPGPVSDEIQRRFQAIERQ